MARQGLLAENPLAHNPNDVKFIEEFKWVYAKLMNLEETGDSEETPLIVEKLPPAINDVSESRRIDAMASIASARAVEALQQVLNRAGNRREDLLKTQSEINQSL